MANMRARNEKNSTATLPDLETQLVLLTAPDLKALVVISELFEPEPIDSEQASGMGRRSEWLAVVLAMTSFSLRDLRFLVEKSPLKDSTVMRVRTAVHTSVLPRVRVDSVDDWNCHDLSIALDGGEKWREPVGVHFAMGVKEEHDFRGGMLGSNGSGTDQAFSLLGSHHNDLSVESSDILVEFLL